MTTKVSELGPKGHRVYGALHGYLERKGIAIDAIDIPFDATIKGTRPYMILNGYDRENDQYVFIKVDYEYGFEHGFPDEGLTKKLQEVMENHALSWIATHSDVKKDTQIRFDVISFVVVKDDKAMIRHHINVFGTGMEGD